MSSTNSRVQQSAWLAPSPIDEPESTNGWLTPIPGDPTEDGPDTLPPEIEEIPAATGPTDPQPHVNAPPDGLPVRRMTATAGLWVIGAHGGAGESSIAELREDWQATGHAWPQLPDDAPAACVLVARSSARGLLAARTALTQWAASAAGDSTQLLALVLISDAPGKQPQPLRDLVKVVGGGAPRVWEVPWSESWRLGDPVTERVPRSVSKIVSQLVSLAAAVPTVAASFTTKEKS